MRTSRTLYETEGVSSHISKEKEDNNGHTPGLKELSIWVKLLQGERTPNNVLIAGVYIPVSEGSIADLETSTPALQ